MTLEGDEQIGVTIVKRALEEPLRLIASNAGHEGADYGTDLPADQKQALLEYLKTF